MEQKLGQAEWNLPVDRDVDANTNDKEQTITKLATQVEEQVFYPPPSFFLYKWTLIFNKKGGGVQGEQYLAPLKEM